MNKNVFTCYTQEDFKMFFKVASHVLMQNLSVSVRKLSKSETEIVNENLKLFYRGLEVYASQSEFRLKKKTCFPLGSLGDAFERALDVCSCFKMSINYPSKTEFRKPQNLKIQLKKERLRQKRNNYLKKSLCRVLTILKYKSKKEK